MPSSVWSGLGAGVTAYAFDGVATSWSSAIGLGSTAPWTTGAPVEIASLHVDWHYGGPYLHDGSPGGVSGAAGPFKLQGSPDGLAWHDVVVDTDPVTRFGAGYPGDFSGDYVIDPPVTYTYWRWTNTSGSNNDWYLLAAYGPEVPPPPPPPSGPMVTINGVLFTSPKEVIIRAELNAAGEGHITLDRNDPQATADNLVRGSICYVVIPEIDPELPVFAFILENGDWDVISSDEEGGEELRFGGPGVLWLLHRAVIAPEEYETGTGYPKPLKGIWVFADGVTEGHILNKLLREAESVSRPQQPLAGVSDDFTSLIDSDGVSWGAEVLDGKWKVPIGAYLYDEVLRLVAAGLIQVEMEPSAGPGEDLVLHARRTIGTDRTGDFGVGVVRFEKGVNIADELVKSMAGRDFMSHAYVRYGEDSGDYTHTAKTGTWPYVQEGYVEANTSAATTARRIAKGQMGWRESAQDAPAFAHIVPWPGTGSDEDAGVYLPGPRWTANGLYWVGDLVTLHTGTGETDYVEQTLRVYAVTLQMDETGYLAPPIVELNSAYSGPSSPDLRSVTSLPGTGGLGAGGGSSSGGGSGGIPGGVFQALAEKGQADGYAGLDGDGLVPIDQLGTGGDGSGDNVLHDDGTWSPGGSSIPAGTYELANEGGQSVIKAHGSMGATETFDPTDGNVHTGTLDANLTVTLNAPSGSGAALLELHITASGTRTWTWPGSVTWIGATPDPPASGLTKIILLLSLDGGTSWLGIPVGGEPTADAHIADTSDAHDASAISVADAGGYYTGTDVEAALQEVPAIATTAAAAAAAAATGGHVHVMDLLFSGDATTTAFPLPVVPFDQYSVAAYVSGVLTEVTLSGTLFDTATFGSAPASATNNIRFDIVAAVA